MQQIKQYPAEVLSISSKTTAKEAADTMLREKVGCLIVKNDSGKFVGIVTERDIVSRVVAPSRNSVHTIVEEVMTSKVITCTPETSTSEAREIMTSHQIRHLPMLDKGIVIGMVSARDLMAKQLVEDRAAAEEVAMLSTCLKSIDINEVANIVTREVPKLFHAERCVLFFQRDDSASLKPELVNYNFCCCPEEFLCQLRENSVSAEKGQFQCNGIPEFCKELGGESLSLTIPLSLSNLDNDKNRKNSPLNGYLCMCGLDPVFAANKELITYKAKLARDILNSHLTNARLYQQARLTSLTDALTSVGSRKLFEDKLEVECARAKRYKRPFSVAIIDLDNFKTINDVLGHSSGDEALKSLAECMKSQKRKPDVLARYGGDEFVYLMPETKAKDAVKLLERLRAKVHKIKLAENLSMTISCGVAQSSADQLDSPSELIRRADLALYEAKGAGKDCVKTWDKSMSKMLSPSDLEVEKIKKLQRRVAGLSEQAEKMFIQSIWGLVQALEAKDPYAKKHSENVMHYANKIAEAMGIGPSQMEVIQRAAMLHDIGKIGVPDAVLSKPDKLTPRERKAIEQHPLFAVRILEKMSFLEQEIAIIRSHHEKWNGQGYPDGLSKSSIPLGARILALADTLDALISNRSYHQSRSVSNALKILVDSSGYEFDPEVIKGLNGWIDKISQELGKQPHELTQQDLLISQKMFNGTNIEEQPTEALCQSSN